MRIQLDIPESEMGEAVKLLALRDVVLQVVICPEGYEGESAQHGSERPGHGRPPRGTGD